MTRPWVTVGLTVLMLFAAALSGWSFYQGHREACHVRDQTLLALHDIFIAAATESDANPAITPQQRARSDRFFKAALARLDQARCN